MLVRWLAGWNVVLVVHVEFGNNCVLSSLLVLQMDGDAI